jgi:hypothetical protein
MKRSSRSKRYRGEPTSRFALASVGFMLACAFVFIAFRNVDILIVTLAMSILSLAGMLTGRIALKKVRRHRSELSGESAATIGYWGNLIVFILSLLAFSWFLALAIIKGDLLL